MSEFTVEVQSRESSGSSVGRRLRRDGLVPCVMYHRHEDSVLGAVSAHLFTKLASVARSSQVFRLKSAVPQVNGRSALVKEVQTEALTNRVLHIDFQLLKDDEEIRVPITLTFTGESTGVKNDGGILTILAHEVTVICLPKDIPAGISVDVSALKVGDNIHAKQLSLPPGVRLLQDDDFTVVSVVAQKAMEVEAPTPAEGAATAEGATAAPAEGAAAAAPAADAKATDAKAAKDEKKK